MATPDPRGAEAAALYFLELHEYTVATGDTGRWDEASDGTCGFCSYTSEDANAIVAGGGRYVGRGTTYGTPRFLALEETLQIFAVEVPVESLGADVYDPSGQRIEQRPGFSGYLILDVGYEPGTGWKLAGLSTSEVPFE